MTVRNKFWISLTVTLSWMVLMGQLIRPLNSKAIVAFEFSGTALGATELIANWANASLLPNVYLSLYLDFIFLILYPSCIYFALRWQSERSAGLSLTVSILLMKVVWVALAADAIENFALLSILSTPTTIATTIAFVSALLKFCIVGLSLVWIVGVVLQRLIVR